MISKIRQGQFKVIDSFAIKRRNEFYLIGEILEGEIKENWFVNVVLNGSLSLTVRIAVIEDVEFASDQQKYKLLIVTGDLETIDFLLGLNIGNELMDITIEGKD